MCEIYDDGERAEVYRERARRAAKVHSCMSCGSVILPGEMYRYASGVHDHRGFSECGCLACATTRDAFGLAHEFWPSFDGLREALRDCIAEGDPESLGWKTHLAAIDERYLDAQLKRVATSAIAKLLEQPR